MKPSPVYLIAIITLSCLSLKVSGQINSIQPTKTSLHTSDVTIESIDDTDYLIAGWEYEPKATFHNSGKVSVTFEATMIIENTYRSSKIVTLEPNASVTVIFDVTTLNYGNSAFIVQLSGEKEGGRFHDSFSKVVTVAEQTNEKDHNSTENLIKKR